MKIPDRVAQYIATRPILDLCEKSIRRTGAWVSRRRWEKEGLDLKGAKERSAAELYGEEGTEQEETEGWKLGWSVIK